MKYSNYKFKFYLNASHSIYINGVQGENHTHTWEIQLNTIKAVEDFIQFNDIEKLIETFLSQYQDKYINDVEPFNSINPTLENICEYFKDKVEKVLFDSGWVLVSIEISETPARSYIIDLVDEIDLNKFSNSRNVNDSNTIDALVNKKLADIISKNSGKSE